MFRPMRLQAPGGGPSCYAHLLAHESLGDAVGVGTGRAEGEHAAMALKAPGILVFLLSVILALAVLFTKFFGATIPMLSGETTQFYGMLLAYVILVFGCIMRGL
jgi:hypothetical protein